jgi:3-deoxy-manno-octulosonate cytidylyltransferase (CMP-KDO synthetase)
MNFHIIIPSRFGSVRLPGKPLIDIEGKPLIQRVYERALLCGAASVTIATDDERIQQAALKFGASICMTAKEHLTGTDRLAEAVSILGLKGEDIVVNMQGDEPFLPKSVVYLAVQAMIQNPEACTTTLCAPIHTREELLDPNIVKVVSNKAGFALYFSRAPIPFDREFNFGSESHMLSSQNLDTKGYYRHLGLYAYRVNTLKQYLYEWEPAPLESIERLEQLRILWNGEKIHVSVIQEQLPPGVDTEADLAKARSFFSKQSLSLS